jgi:hypothetical protein
MTSQMSLILHLAINFYMKDLTLHNIFSTNKKSDLMSLDKFIFKNTINYFIKCRWPSLFADFVFAVLTIRGSEIRVKSQIPRE